MSESKETRQYLSSVNIERTRENIEFSFDPAVPTEEISETMQDYFRDVILENGGDVVIQTVDGKSCFTKIVIPKSFARKTILAIFRQLEQENICSEITEADLEKSRKKETAGAISTKQQGTGRAVQQAVNPKQQQAQERREGPQFGVQARITTAEKSGNDLRLNVDAYLHTGTGRNNRDYKRVEPVIFEYNGVQKELTTSRIGKIRQRTLYFRDAFKTGEKLRVWPKAFPNEFIELTVNPREAQPPKRTPAPGENEARGEEEMSLSPQIDELRQMTERLSEEVGKLLDKTNQQGEELKAAAKREEELKKKIEVLDEKKQKEAEKKAREEKEKAEADEKARREAEEQAQRVQAEKERQEQEFKRIGNAAAQYLIYGDIAVHLPDQQKNRIERLAKELREGKVEGSNKKYAETLLEMRVKYTPQKVEKASTDIWVELNTLMKNIDLPMSPYTASKSWVLWDMAKQTYLAEHPSESTPDYTLGNPMENEKICRQISDRHFGWELHRQYRSSADAMRKIDEALQNSPHAQRAQQLLNKAPNSKGTIRSIELEVLGGVVRTAMEDKKEAEEARQQQVRKMEQAQRDYEQSLEHGREMRVDIARGLLSQKGKLEIKKGQTLVLPKEQFEVQADIFIEPGGELHINAGTRLLFGEEGGIVSRGLMKAQGTEAAPIVFMNKEKDKPWKNITLEGGEQNLLENCIIQGGGGRIFTFDYEKNKARIDETGNNPQKNEKNGGGLACVDGCTNTVLNGVTIQGCRVGGDGGGIWNYEASPKLNSVLCGENQARYGGGIYVIGGNPQLNQVICEKNIASMNGGGMCIAKGSPTVDNCIFEGNTAENGGGIAVTTDQDTLPVFTENKVTNNRAKKCGGGLYLYINYHGSDTSYYPVFTGVIKTKGNQAIEGGGSYVYHKITKHKYEEHGHDFSMGSVEYSQNTPDSTKQVFRSTEPAKGKGHH